MRVWANLEPFLAASWYLRQKKLTWRETWELGCYKTGVRSEVLGHKAFTAGPTDHGPLFCGEDIDSMDAQNDFQDVNQAKGFQKGRHLMNFLTGQGHSVVSYKLLSLVDHTHAGPEQVATGDFIQACDAVVKIAQFWASYPDLTWVLRTVDIKRTKLFLSMLITRGASWCTPMNTVCCTLTRKYMSRQARVKELAWLWLGTPTIERHFWGWTWWPRPDGPNSHMVFISLYSLAFSGLSWKVPQNWCCFHSEMRS